MCFLGSKMSINEPKMFMNFYLGQKWSSMSHKLFMIFLWVRYAMGKIPINNPHSGVGLAHEKFNSL